MRLLNKVKSSKVKVVAVTSAGLVLGSVVFGFVGGSGASQIEASPAASDDASKGSDGVLKPGAWSVPEGLAVRVASHRFFRHQQSSRLLLEVEVDFENYADFTYRVPRQWFDLTLPDGRVVVAEQMLQEEDTGRLVVGADEEATAKVLFWMGSSGSIPEDNMMLSIREIGSDPTMVELEPVGLSETG